MSVGQQVRDQVWVRFADPEKEPVREWAERNNRNGFDPEVLTYPSTKVLASQKNGTVQLYLQVQGTAMQESIAPNPASGASPEAILEAVKAAMTLSHGAGFRELYFLASDENTAEGSKLLGFEELPYKVYRRRLK